MELQEQIEAGAAAILGEVTSYELLTMAVKAAAQRVTGLLAPGMDVSLCQDACETAGAFFAAAMVESASSAGGLSSFSAGDFSATISGDRAQALEAQGLKVIAPYSGDFGFISVKG